MKRFLEQLSCYPNIFLTAFLALFVVPFLALIPFSEPKDTLQALGNLIGAMIGAFGAGAAVVWQLDRKNREEARHLFELRLAAFRNIRGALETTRSVLLIATFYIERRQFHRAAEIIKAATYPLFVVDNRFHSRLLALEPTDIRFTDLLASSNVSLVRVANNYINAVDAGVPGPEHEIDLKVAIIVFIDLALDFLMRVGLAIPSSIELQSEFEDLRKKVALSEPVPDSVFEDTTLSQN